jgi:hypothetical protein
MKIVISAPAFRNVFFLNCAVHAPAMYGAVEALFRFAYNKCM